MDNNDWGRFLESFDKINKQLEKFRCVSGKVPKLYIRTLVMLEDFLARDFPYKDAKRMKQKLKKNNKQYEDLISKCRENPESYGEDSNDEYESHDEIIDADLLITWHTVNKKFKELVAARGRKKNGRFSQVEQLTYLKKFIFSAVSTQFDVNPSLIEYVGLLDILEQHPNIKIDVLFEPDDYETKKGSDYNGQILVWEKLVDFLEKRDADFFKSLQFVDPHTREYGERLQDEPMFVALAQKVQEYLERIEDFKGSSKVSLMRVELINIPNIE